MEAGTVNVGGTLDASARMAVTAVLSKPVRPVKVADGARVTTGRCRQHRRKWLIDLNDFTISATGD